MLKKTITYEDYNGVERTEDFYFNLSEAELMEMQMGTTGGLAEQLKAIINSNDTPAIMRIFKELLLKAYGEKSPDGKFFRKSEEISEAFSHTEAYSQLYMELFQNTEEATKFVNGIIPKKLSRQLAEHPELTGGNVVNMPTT